MKMTTKLLVDSLLSNPNIQLYISTNGVGIFYTGLAGEVPQFLGDEESKYLQEAIMGGTAIKVLSPIMNVGHIPENTCIAVVASHRNPPAELRYCHKLAKDGFTLCEQLIIQKHRNIPKWNFGPLGIDRVDSLHKGNLTKYVWVTNSGAGHVDFHPMTEDELKGMETLVQKKVFIPAEYPSPFYSLLLTTMTPDRTKLPSYIYSS